MIEYLGHQFIEYDINSKDFYYFKCNKCLGIVFKFEINDSDDLLRVSSRALNTIKGHGRFYLDLTCDEVIIKNIIE